jgi:UPF0271 protein
MARTIDLNCDLGEEAGADAAIMAFISSANIACGGHAGDEATMRAAVDLARMHRVAIGAHPGLPDRGSFGRGGTVPAPEEVAALVQIQVASLQAVAPIRHVKLHGLLYHAAAGDPAVAEAVAGAVRAIDPGLLLYAMAGSELVMAGRRLGLRVVEEAFADRRYAGDGSLVPRSRPGAILTDNTEAATQALAIVRDSRVRAASGRDLFVFAETICLHGDSPGAAGLAQAVHAALEQAGVAVQAP